MTPSKFTPPPIELSDADYRLSPDTAPRPPHSDEHKRRLKICAMIDLIDGCFGWIPGVGQLIDVVAVCMCVSMFGPKGFLILLEMIDITGLIGAFVPSCTLVAWSCGEKKA